MKTLNNLSKNEKSLLLFFETCAVDQGGRIKSCHMNNDDFYIAEKWDEEKFISFGRICSKDVNEYGSHWCKFSEDAWKLAHEERKARAERLWNSRMWKTTEENRKID